MAHELRLRLTADQKRWVELAGQKEKGLTPGVKAERWAYRILLSEVYVWRDKVLELETKGIEQRLPRPPTRTPLEDEVASPNPKDHELPPPTVTHHAGDLDVGHLENPEEYVADAYVVRIPDSVWPMLVKGLAFQNLWHQTRNAHKLDAEALLPIYPTVSEWAVDRILNFVARSRSEQDRTFQSPEEEEIYPGLEEELSAARRKEAEDVRRRPGPNPTPGPPPGARNPKSRRWRTPAGQN